MKLDIVTLGGDTSGSVDLSDDVFGVEPRADILYRVVRWQQAKAQAGTHKVKGRSEISATTAKMYKQKGTGHARHGSKRVPQFRGGGRAMGPVVRSHAHDLQKKVRVMGLKMALSAKAKDGALSVLDSNGADGKTATLRKAFAAQGWTNVLIIDGPEVDAAFERAARNIPNVDVLPSQGANVYDILKRDRLVLTPAAVEALEARLK